MPEKEWTTDEIIVRLGILYRVLDEEGSYVRANTVWLAIEEIKRMSENNSK